MKMMIGMVMAVAFAPAASAQDADPFLWLEEIQSPKALEWVQAHNERSIRELTGDPRYKRIEADARAIIAAKDRLPMPSLANGWIYNFWQDGEHQRGLWRRTRPEEYAKPRPKWETLLDVDKLNNEEKQDWVFEGADCLPPSHEDCLVSLSHGGKDALIVREFDIARDTWVAGGFEIAEAKTSIDWVDKNEVLVATDFGPGSMNNSGYPLIAKLWRRGESLSQARTLLETPLNEVGIQVWSVFRPEGSLPMIQENVTFWNARNWLLEPDESLRLMPFPEDANLLGAFKGEFFAILRSDWKTGAKTYAAGSVVGLPLSSFWDARPADSVDRVYAPDARSSAQWIAASKDELFVVALQNVQGRVLRAKKSSGAWTLDPLPFPALGVASVVDADAFSDGSYFRYQAFLTPMTLYDADLKPVKSVPARFDVRGLVVEQLEATSADGTKIPYFLVHRKGLKYDGSQPTLLYGYGGFEEPMTPEYDGVMGKLWLERGGAYALANIRGGGEFGPKWHEAALKEHRQRAFDDFAAVAKDLIARKITSPRRLGIMGGSNGGLLMGVEFTQHPELFHAVVCQVPLLDMLRYTKIAAGASWIDEYGDPADPKMREAIEKYSPYQNVRSGVAYPEIFFLTSTKDDRVGPVHARKMAAKLESLGGKALYWENIEGGHGAAADLDENVKNHALEFTFLLRKLAD